MEISASFKNIFRFGFPFLLASFLTACQISSPLTASDAFLGNLSRGQFDQALTLIVAQDKENRQLRSLTEKETQEWLKTTQDRLGTINQYSVENSVPLNEEDLKEFGAIQGYQVFYVLKTEKTGLLNLNFYVFRFGKNWKILKPDF